ncbi:MAG: rhodanese-like domain-containing protein [Flavobacteriales bacterium]|nr:rhodanese-like domain-containing protein [Flavobacteriales bacterium]
MFESIKSMFFGPSTDYQALIKNGAKVIDVRTPSEYASGHVKGSVNIPVHQLPSQINKIKKMNCPIILCCASGMRAASAKHALQAQGIEVHNAGSWHSLM